MANLDQLVAANVADASMVSAADKEIIEQLSPQEVQALISISQKIKAKGMTQLALRKGCFYCA